VSFLHLLLVGTADSADSETTFSVRSYRPGRFEVGWNRAPLGPAFGDPDRSWGVTRTGKQLAVAVPLVSVSDHSQYTAPPAAMTGTTTLSRDGSVLGTSARPGFGNFPIPDTPGTYTLHATATRSVPWSVIGTRADVVWTFREPGAAAPVRPLPLLVVRASGQVDDQGRAKANRAHILTLAVQGQPGARAVRLAALQVEASFDNGATWVRVPTIRVGEGGKAVLQHPAGDGFVSLRVTARDTHDNAVTQTVIRAYQIAA
jgi:hypothetical protein